jgi:hypothetical protein
MQRHHILFVLLTIILFVAPVAGNLNKIAAGSPIFIGESNVDISSAMSGCHTIAWWQNTTDKSTPPDKKITIWEMNTEPEKIFLYTFSPKNFTDYTGSWYCIDKQPYYFVFEVFEPKVAIQVWDLDHNMDVTGKQVPVKTNVTYRINTNLYPALKSSNRPDYNPSDSFFTIKLTGPYEKNIPNIYTGSPGNPSSQILQFDNNPLITSSSYSWRDGYAWNRLSRTVNGDLIYPPGDYTFTVIQNLNHMQETYKAGGIDTDGKITQSATITFSDEGLSIVTPATTPTVITTIPATIPVSPATKVTTVSTSSPIAQKTTYQPLPEWIALMGIVIAGIFFANRVR